MNAVVEEVVTESVVVMSREEEEAQIERIESERRGRMDQIGQTLSAWKQEAIMFRSEVELEWLEAHYQYDQGDIVNGDLRGTREFPADSASDYRRTRDNITRPAVLTVTSRVSDMLFPTSDRNWDMTPSPDAEMPPDILAAEVDKILSDRRAQAEAIAQAQAQQSGGAVQPPTEEQQLGYDTVESIEQRAAEARCRRMRSRIDDQMAESSYSAHARDTIADSVMYGTGVIKGPFPKKRRARVYDQQQRRWVSKYIEIPAPAACYVDVFNFYPRPARRMTECPGTFQLHLMPAEGLRKLSHQPGFDREQIARCLRDENRSTGCLSMSVLYRAGVTSRSGLTASMLDNRYAIWEYHGSMPKQGIVDFTAGLLQQGLVDPDIVQAILGEVQDDPMLEVNCEVWECNGIVIKMALSPVRDCSTIYHVYNYEERPDILFGKGVPMVLRDDQLATTQLWQAMMLNAMMSAGLQIGVVKGALEPMGPQGGKHDLTFSRPRVWAFTDDVKDIREAMQCFTVPSVLGDLLPLYERSKQNAEEHIVLPAIAQGEPTQSVQTSSGLAMLMNASNIVSRRLAKAWDDNVTTPLLTGFFDYNMDHGPDDVKGDYTVIPRGSSHLLVKDVQSQRFLYALQMYSVNPKLESRMKWDEWARQGLTIMDMDANRLLYDDAEMKAIEREQAASPPAPDPQTVTAQARMIEAETRARIADGNVELQKLRLDTERENIELSHRYDTAELEQRERIAQLQLMPKLAKIEADERVAQHGDNTKREAEGMHARLEAGKMAARERRDALEVTIEAPNPRLA